MCFKTFLLDKKPTNDFISKFQRSILIVVSRSFCEHFFTNDLFTRASRMISDSFFLAKSAAPLNQLHKSTFEKTLDLFHTVVKTKKFKKAIKILIDTMEIKLTKDAFKKKMIEITDHLSKLNPILAENFTFNGMISPDFNMFLNATYIHNVRSLKNHEKLNYFQKLRAALCSLLRLMIHESSHIIIRFFLSENNYDYLKSTPPNKKDSNNLKYFDFEGGYRLEMILFGVCEKAFFSQDEFNKRVLKTDNWNDKKLPFFSKDEEIEMESVTKNVYFSGIDDDDEGEFE